MNLRFLIFLLPLLFVSSLFALDVNKQELKDTVSDETIVFKNYTGPHKRIDSLKSIKAIGTALGKELKDRLNEEASTEEGKKYRVIHAYDPKEETLLDADILILEKESGVDHINNLRHIISSYLMEAYGYSEEDGETLAVFITVYNAVYRNRLEDLGPKYKKVVNKNLHKEKTGIALDYSQWPGNTELVIPLNDINGGLSTIETSIISDENVVSRMQEDDDKNIEARKQMVDIKERESENAFEEAENAQKEAVQEQKKLDEEVAKTKALKEEVERQEEYVKSHPEDKKAQEKLKETKKKLEEQKDKENKQREKTENARKKAEKKQTVSDKKNTEAIGERKTISSDMQKIIEEKEAESKLPSSYTLILTDEDKLYCTLVKVNTETGKIIRKSSVKEIHNRTIIPEGTGFICIAGENTGKNAVKLVRINIDTLNLESESEEILSNNSVLVQDGSDLYCITQDEDGSKVTRYNFNLENKATSEKFVKDNTPITITDQKVLVTGKDGKMLVLSKEDLK